MKIYHLVIAYNDKTEEIEYIQEHVEETIPELLESDVWSCDFDPEYWDDEDLIALIEQGEMGEA